eukprot:133277-Prymnesium_polylepis.1
MVYIVEVPLRAALMLISKLPWAQLNRRGHNRPEPFLPPSPRLHSVARPPYTQLASDTARAPDKASLRMPWAPP